MTDTPVSQSTIDRLIAFAGLVGMCAFACAAWMSFAVEWRFAFPAFLLGGAMALIVGIAGEARKRIEFRRMEQGNVR